VSELGATSRPATLVSVDVLGFSRDTEEARSALTRALDLVSLRLETAADRHEGRVVRQGDDGFVLAFARPDQAIAAADEIAKGPRPPVRVGVHLGPVTIGAGGELQPGDTVEAAEAIQKAAARGVVLVSDIVKRAVKDTELSKRLTKDSVSVRGRGGATVQACELTEPVDIEVVKKQTRRNLAIGAGVTVVAAGLAWGLFGHEIMTIIHPKHDHVAVQNFRTAGAGGAAADFRDGLTDEIDYVLNQGQIPTVARADAESLRGAERKSKVRTFEVGAILDGSVEGDANNLSVKLHIDDPVHQQRIWSHDFTGSGDDLKAQVSSRVIQVLTCSAQALRPGAKETDPAVLALYVKYCDFDVDAAGNPKAQAEEETILRQLTAKAPDFSYGHSTLANFLVSKSQANADPGGAIRQEAGREADKAISADPKNSNGYVARTRLLQSPNWDQREKNLALALSLPAAGYQPPTIYAQMLLEVGRLREAAYYAQRAASLSPWDADEVGLSGLALAEAGKPDDADVALTKSIQIVANDPNVQAWRYHIYQWTGRYDDALKLLADEANRPPILAQEDDLGASRAFNTAMLKGDPASKSAAREAELASVRQDRSHLMVALSHLSALGLVDDAYALAAQNSPSAQSDDVSVLFTPLADGLRRDPRFLALAGKLGLVTYWKAAGHWPDFCGAPGLPYDCKTGATRLAAK
jgi:class 3 adenylate cyclase/tetratricopeptide (TPR) repeat protein